MTFYLSKSLYQQLPPAELIRTIRELGARGTACAAWLRILDQQRWTGAGRERLVA